MTSDLNDSVIRENFKLNNYFGYPEDSIFFFEQGLQPCLSNDGKVLMENEYTLSMAPDGNGGIYLALEVSGAYRDMLRRGIEHIHVYGIDNVLTKSLDPAFLGLCIDQKVEVGNKVVWRANKGEKVGVTVTDQENCMRVLEYSEIPSQLAEASDSDGRLVFGAANICNHYLSIEFLSNKVYRNLVEIYHVAKKKIPYFDPTNKQYINPTANNGIKLEMFIFDVFPLADKWLVMEVDRKEEFAPVKNEPGNPVDSPDTARYLLTEQAKRWLHKVGAKLVDSAGNSVSIDFNELVPSKLDPSGLQCEISNLISYAGENLDSFKSQIITLPKSID